MIKFGPSGNSELFYEQGYSSSLEAPAWLAELGLSAYEYQCSRGINISADKAIQLGINAKQNGIFLSIHAPYYINLANADEQKRLNSIKYIIDTMKVADLMGAQRVVVHPGSCAGVERKEALALAADAFKKLIDEADRVGVGHINVCPETMGKINQLGDTGEIIDLCSVDERLIPTLDFGHIHARDKGSLNSTEEYETIFKLIENKLGSERLNKFHCHFSRIEFTNGGEKKHWTLKDTQFGPEFKILAEVLAKRNLSPVIICESRGTMAEDAMELKKIYESFL